MSLSFVRSRSMSSFIVVKLGYGPQLLSITPPPIGRWQRAIWDCPRASISSSARYIEAPIKPQMDNLFIAALVKAGTCSQHLPGKQLIKTSPSRPSPCLKTRKRIIQASISYRRAFHSPSSHAQSPIAAQELSQDDYKQMVDYYYDSSYEEIPDSPHQQTEGLPVLEDVRFDGSIEVHTPCPDQSTNTTDKPVVEYAIKIIMDPEASQDELFQSYQFLPFPGVYYLPPDVRRMLLQRLSVMEKKTEKAMLRYLSVIDDMKAAKLPLSNGEWSSAIYLAGRSFPRVSATNVESALRIWKEMEQEAGILSDNVTFSILFDIAAKAGKFVLAEMILKEMKARKLRVNRFAHVGIIYYYGLRGDGDGVRKAYRELVESGQIVDTTVLNCVVASLLRSGELPAADQVYQRMRTMHARKTGAKVLPTTWKSDRELGKSLNRLDKRFRNEPTKRQQLQDEQLLAPNRRTYVIFLEHHVSRTGELHRVVSLLDEMQVLGLPVHGRLFGELFRGFAMHGGIRYTSWTEVRLESVWISFVQAVGQSQSDVFVGKWIAVWVLRAFIKCCGEGRTLEIWDELQTKWEPTMAETEIIHEILHKVRKSTKLVD